MPLREDIYKILTELDRRRAEELDHTLQAETPGTPSYASGAIADLFPSPNAFLATTQIPFLSDAAGLASDIEMYRDNPESRNWLNYGLSGLGMLPFVPGVVGMMRKAPYDDALKAAQEHAALPPSKGGLGLPPDNTAADRARAMGYTTPVYHGTFADITEFDPQKSGIGTHVGTLEHAETRLKDLRKAEDSVVIPLLMNPGKTRTVRDLGAWNDSAELLYTEAANGRMLDEFDEVLEKRERFGDDVDGWINSKENRQMLDKISPALMGDADTLQYQNWVEAKYGQNKNLDSYVVPDSSRLRSRFAAFDPFRRNEADLLAQYALPLGLGSLLAFPFMTDEQQTY